LDREATVELDGQTDQTEERRRPNVVYAGEPEVAQLATVAQQEVLRIRAFGELGTRQKLTLVVFLNASAEQTGTFISQTGYAQVIDSVASAPLRAPAHGWRRPPTPVRAAARPCTPRHSAWKSELGLQLEKTRLEPQDFPVADRPQSLSAHRCGNVADVHVHTLTNVVTLHVYLV
jgi:hypothetical protein